MACLVKFFTIFAVLASLVRCAESASASASSSASEESHASSERAEGEEGEYTSEEDQEEEQEDNSEPEKDAEPLSSDQMHTLHGRVDVNRDGKVTLVELMGFFKQMRKSMAKKSTPETMAELDKNSDSKLSLTEMLADLSESEESEEDKANNAIYKAIQTKKFKAADSNNNGFLEEEELPAVFYSDTHDAVLQIDTEAAMKEMDTDGNGVLSPKELFHSDASAGAGEPGTVEDEHAKFQKLDTNGDGSLSIDELKPHEAGWLHAEMAFEHLIALADKDGDKMVTADELDKARKPIAETEAHYHLMDWRDSDDDEL